MPERLPAPVRWLLVANIVIFGVGAFSQLFHISVAGHTLNEWMLMYGALVPELTWGRFQFWRIFTYMFLHGGMWHLLFNMLTLWMFGMPLCWVMGERRFLALYFFSGIVAGLGSIVFYPLTGQSSLSIIGASGALFGLMWGYAKYFPEQRLLVFFFFPMQAKHAVWLFGAISLFFAMGNSGGIAHATHIFGLLGAFLFFRFGESWGRALEKLSLWHETRQVRKAAEELINHEEFMDTRVDPILQKISRHGMESLSRQERDVLERASRSRRPESNPDVDRWRRDNNR